MACHHQGGSEGGVNEQKQFVHFWLIKLDSKSYWSSYCVSQPLSKATAVKVAESPLKFSPTCSGHMISWQVKSVKISVIAHDSVAIAFGSRRGGSSLELPQFFLTGHNKQCPNPSKPPVIPSYWFILVRFSSVDESETSKTKRAYSRLIDPVDLGSALPALADGMPS
jgi:hypothetical protein